ncbi:hypothetical protein AB0H76_39045 [Nocardia sp. NPDC050712]|uniref:hypothetical protein n=1 Tax=Actinomycetes TaxID=1760 RepID=UPI0033DF6687
MSPVDNVIQPGQIWKDRRADNIRSLRVERIEAGRVYLTVVRQTYQGVTTEPMRPTDMTVARLLSRSFVLEQEAVR